MNVSSVKNLNGSVFSAVQDAELTEVVQTNSASWGASTIPTDLSANHITANSGFKIGNLAYGEYGYEGYGMNFDRTLGSITIMPNTAQGGGSNYGNINLTSKSGWGMGISTAECSINAFDWNKVNDASDTVITNSATWGQGGAGDPEVESYVQSNSGTIDDTVTAYQTNSSTYLTAHQAISAGEWNDCYNNVNTNSGVWGGSALLISAGPGIKVNLVDNTLLFSNDETVLWEAPTISGVRLTTETSLNEPGFNFEKIQLQWCGSDGVNQLHITEIRPCTAITLDNAAGWNNVYWHWARISANDNFSKIIMDGGKSINFGSRTATAWSNPTVVTGVPDSFYCYKIVGINRINGGN